MEECGDWLKEKEATISHSLHYVFFLLPSKYDSLDSNKLGAEGAKAVAEALKHNNTLTKLECDDEMRMSMMTMMGCVDG